MGKINSKASKQPGKEIIEGAKPRKACKKLSPEEVAELVDKTYCKRYWRKQPIQTHFQPLSTWFQFQRRNWRNGIRISFATVLAVNWKWRSSRTSTNSSFPMEIRANSPRSCSTCLTAMEWVVSDDWLPRMALRLTNIVRSAIIWVSSWARGGAVGWSAGCRVHTGPWFVC